MKLLLPVIVFALFFTSCSKPKDNLPSTGEIAYFQYWKFDTTAGAGYLPYSRFVAYNIDKGVFLWDVRDKYSYCRSGVFRVTGGNYYEPIRSGDQITRIYAAVPKALQPWYGVVMVKTDIANGKELLNKLIVPGSDLLPITYNTRLHGISNVISLNGNFIFGCTNGKIYCVNELGNTVWTYNNYKPAFKLDGQFYLYNDDNHIYFKEEPTSTTAGITCLNATNGSVVWQHPSGRSASLMEMYITSKYVYNFLQDFPQLINKNTGEELDAFLFTGQTYFPLGFGTSNPDFGFYFTDNAYVGVLNANDPLTGYHMGDPLPENPFQQGAFEYNQKFYGFKLGPSSVENKILSCYDPAPTVSKVIWTVGNASTEFSMYRIKNGKLYVWGNITGGAREQVQTSGGRTIAVIDLNTGAVIKASKSFTFTDSDNIFGPSL